MIPKFVFVIKNYRKFKAKSVSFLSNNPAGNPKKEQKK